MKYLQITSATEKFGNLEEMYVEEIIGSLKAHEERLRRQTETHQGQLLLTEEDWRKKESSEGQLLLTREEWLKKTNKEGTLSSTDLRGRDGNRGVRDRSKIRCFNCQSYGHYASECRKPRRDVRDVQKEVNLTKLEEDEPALLFTKCGSEETDMIMLNEERVVP